MNHTTSPLNEEFPSVRASGKDELREYLYKLSGDLFDAKRNIYYYRDTKDWDDDGLAEAESIVDKVATALSRNYGGEIDQLIAASNQQAVQKALEGLLLEAKHMDDFVNNVEAVPISAIESALAAAQPRKDERGAE